MIRLVARRALVGTSIVAIAAALLLGSAGSASADSSTTITFGTATPSSTVGFGATWVIPITVVDPQGIPVDSTAGTVDVVAQGLPGTFVSGLQLSPGGIAYLTQPSAVPLLSPGDHQFTATFQPAAATGYATSQTATAADLTITGSTATAAATLERPADGVTAGIRVRLLITAKDSSNVAGGSWAVDVTPTNGGAKQSYSITGATASQPVQLAIGESLKDGRNYTVTAAFTPAPALAPGVEVAQPTKIQFSTTAVPLVSQIWHPPLWAAIAGGVFLLALVVGAVLILVRIRRRRTAVEPAAEPEAVAAL